MSYDLEKNWSLGMTPEADVLLNGSGSNYHTNLTNAVGIGRSVGKLTLGAKVWSPSPWIRPALSASTASTRKRHT